MINNSREMPKSPKKELRPDISKIQIQAESLDDMDDSERVLWLDFQSGDDAEGVKSAGVETYVISPVSEKNLFSDKYLNCTGTVGIGRDKVSGKEIAFISHQDPDFFLKKGTEGREKFIADLKATLDDLVNRSEENTVEVVIFGGNDDPSDDLSKKSVDYKESVDTLTEIIRDSIGREPTMLGEPNHGDGAIDVTVLTQQRKIVIDR